MNKITKTLAIIFFLIFLTGGITSLIIHECSDTKEGKCYDSNNNEINGITCQVKDIDSPVGEIGKTVARISLFSLIALAIIICADMFIDIYHNKRNKKGETK